MRCSNCREDFPHDSVIDIDGRPVCLNCLYGDAEPVTIRPIGVVISDVKRADSYHGFGYTGSDISEIRLSPGMARFMKGLADETRLIVLWHLHEAKPVKSVFARGSDGKQVGPFASRTPDRITPIAVSEVELLDVKGTTLIVRGLDAINGSPVLDIKVGMGSLKRDEG